MEAMAPDETEQGHRRRSEGEDLEDAVQDQIRATEQEIRAKEEEIKAKEEEIRAKEEEVRAKEEEIRAKEEEIRAKEEGIRAVETEIGTASGDKARKPLEAKLQFLRQQISRIGQHISSRNQQIVSLGQQISSFRQEVSSLRSVQAAAASSDKCTEFDWLRQDLPSWVSGNSKPPSATQKERMYTPVRVEYWDVVKDIEDYLNKADKLKRIYRKVDDSVFTAGKKSVVAIAYFVVNSTCEFVSKKRPDSSVTYDGEVNLEVPPEPSAEGGESTNTDGSKAAGRDVQKCFFYARPPRVDVFIRSNGEAVAVLELKSGGLGCPVPIHKLWTRCSCQTGIDPNCWCHTNISEGHARSILNCSLQVYEYLVLAKVGYGVLTDIQNWYLCKRDHGGCLYISTGFKLDGRKPPVPAAIAYLVNSAVEAHGEFDVLPRKGERPWSWEVSPCANPSSGSKDDEDEGRTYKPNEREIGGYRTSPARTRRGSSNATQNQLQEIPAPDLHLDDRPISSGGWSGSVVGGTLNGRRVAVKLAPRNSERAEALLNEVDAYLKLQKYWGEFVPPLVGFGTTANGQIVFIATELIDGSPLGPGTVTEEVANAARKGLDAVHKCKLLHGDVEARNIMVVRGTQPSVRLVDFGFAKRSNNKESQREERGRLEDLLQDMMRVRVGKAFDDVRYPRTQLCSV
ncbi:uncharacterized protein [Physcomitrium patens]|uniref:Protein kinase domain-containing protein n=1 Tax=Physcomitrium patens TaxID=3218 RepID=A0A2K1IFN0_PHYPA|nr:uncharacterized protein LOC112277003 [Physcomitrium patens]PNR28080.1 hypothetical protein PHYPA_028672 [Physcomitrium patens]|eukprot:XP_024364685.1 uncharacterized protein LOC112277003 [Physcomitrella patens]